jgi:hypothetical protein
MGLNHSILHTHPFCPLSTPTFYLPLFNSGAKKLLLGRKEYWRGVCPPLHPTLPQVMPMDVDSMCLNMRENSGLL